MKTLIITLVSKPEQYTLEEPLVNTLFRKLEKKGYQIANFHWLSTNEACDIELYADDVVTIRALVTKILEEFPVDVFVQEKTENRMKKLLISDMDSTIIEQECIDELADVLGIKEQVSEITTRAMNGEIDFPSALRERVALLKGLKSSDLQGVYDDKISFMAGAKTLVATMNKKGTRCVLVSGGFTFFTEQVAKKIGFESHHANMLDFQNGILTGNVVEPILDKEAKVHALQQHAKELGISEHDVVALGDGANDLPMLRMAGLGVACHAKKAVKDEISYQVNHTTLESALFLQGIKRSEFVSN